MLKRIILLTVFGILLAMQAQAANAQEFRIYTRIHDQTAKQPAIVTRSLALFHAGKVYDHIGSVGEVIIFEPMRSRFTILNTERALATTIHFDEIKKMLKSARKVSEEHLAKIAQQNDAEAVAAARLLRFQLKPQFEPAYDATTKQITLASHHLQYKARITAVENKKVAAAYRQYADWINRLNYVLHPRILLPGSRLLLNEQLQRRQSIPVEVTLRVNLQRPVHLRVEHLIQWSLFDRDRAQLNEWNSLLTDRGTRKLTFKEYQRALLNNSKG